MKLLWYFHWVLLPITETPVHNYQQFVIWLQSRPCICIVTALCVCGLVDNEEKQRGRVASSFRVDFSRISRANVHQIQCNDISTAPGEMRARWMYVIDVPFAGSHKQQRAVYVLYNMECAAASVSSIALGRFLLMERACSGMRDCHLLYLSVAFIRVQSGLCGTRSAGDDESERARTRSLWTAASSSNRTHAPPKANRAKWIIQIPTDACESVLF